MEYNNMIIHNTYYTHYTRRTEVVFAVALFTVCFLCHDKRKKIYSNRISV